MGGKKSNVEMQRKEQAAFYQNKDAKSSDSKSIFHLTIKLI